jgi:ribose-phosphate pyrophosphokinase
MLNNTVIFALSRSQELTKKICDILNIEVGKCNVKNFADGETLINIEQSVRGQNVYVVQSTCAPTNESIMELLIMIDALKRASANSINVIVPYYGYARQDRKAKPRQPITARLIADMLQTAGANRIITFDLHASQIQGFFTIPIDDIYALPILANQYKEIKNENLVVVSPDHGGVKRARSLAKALDCPIAIIDKRRPKDNVAEVMNIIGDVKGKVAIMIDDMIDTAGTICAGAKAIKQLGATRVLACCSHAVLSGPAIENIQNSVIEELITTDTIELSDYKKIDKIKVVSVSNILATVIDHIENIKPVSEAVQLELI